MTCVVSMIKDDVVYMGADSFGGDMYTYNIRNDKKMFVNGDYLIGFTTSYRMGQLLMYEKLPKLKYSDSQDMFKFMVVKFIPRIREILEKGGFTTISNNNEEGGTFIVGVNGSIFSIYDDFQVAMNGNFDSCGCGADVAWASMRTMIRNKVKLNIKDMIKESLQVASERSSGVMGPFHVMSIEKKLFKTKNKNF